MNRKLGCLRETLYAITLVASQCELLAANSTTLSVTLVTNVSATTLVPNVSVTGDRGIYALQYARGMGGGQTNWGTLTNITLSSAMTNWLDFSGVGQAQRFYRTVAEMALIPEGSFQMGDCMYPNEGNTNELPVHTVNVSAFYMDKNLVTKSLWDEVYHWATNNGYGSYGSGSQTDPRGFSSGSKRVMRGGGWAIIAGGCRAANRGNDEPVFSYPFVGLRSVLPPPSQP
jgi:formylglycine-generating enzyme required for sulfatase activity